MARDESGTMIAVVDLGALASLPRDGLLGLLDRAIAVQQPQVDATLRLLRWQFPEHTPAQVVTLLERTYLTTVSAAGASVGAAAAAPGVGTGVAVALGGGELAFSLNAAVLYALAVAAVHGERPDEAERRRLLVLAALGGRRGTEMLEEAAGLVAGSWGVAAVRQVPAGHLLKVQRALGQHFVTAYGAAQSRVVWGKVLPFGFGAVLGGVGNALVGHGVVRSVRDAFGTAPVDWSVDTAS
jgi:hypothetical protein